jgi:hypothetical protein
MKTFFGTRKERVNSIADRDNTLTEPYLATTEQDMAPVILHPPHISLESPITHPSTATKPLGTSTTPLGTVATQWNVALVRTPGMGDAAWNAQLAEKLTPLLSEQLRLQPHQRHFTFRVSPLHEVHFTLASGKPTPEKPGAFTFVSESKPTRPLQSSSQKSGSPLQKRSGSSTGDDLPPLMEIALPNEDIYREGQRLVGLEAIREELLLHMACQWDGALQEWARKTGQPLPADLEESLTQSFAMILLYGDPGTGKSALARVVSDAYCRLHGIAGSILTLTTQVRGNGLVGNFAGNIWGAADQLRQLPSEGLRVLTIEEAEGVSVRRSVEQAHQEEKAATDSLLQVSDELKGESRLIVFLTTNQPDEIDPALRRRCIAEFGFGRPSPAARRVLLMRQLPAFDEAQISTLVEETEGMTPVDMRSSLRGAYLTALSKTEALSFEAVCAVLSSRHRTQSV